MRLVHTTFWQMNLPHSRLINCPPCPSLGLTHCVFLATATAVQIVHAKIPKDINKLDDNCTGSSYIQYHHHPSSHAHPHAAHYATPTPTHNPSTPCTPSTHTHTHAHTLLKVSHSQPKERFLCNVISCAI